MVGRHVRGPPRSTVTAQCSPARLAAILASFGRIALLPSCGSVWCRLVAVSRWTDSGVGVPGLVLRVAPVVSASLALFQSQQAEVDCGGSSGQGRQGQVCHGGRPAGVPGRHAFLSTFTATKSLFVARRRWQPLLCCMSACTEQPALQCADVSCTAAVHLAMCNRTYLAGPPTTEMWYKLTWIQIRTVFICDRILFTPACRITVTPPQ